MRRAQLVGLSADGRFLIVATESGEQLALPADGRLRAAVHGDRPRLGQLEIEMESALTPREIQTRIRSGESLEDVAKVAGIPLDRVERFAAPVIAEREYVASQALSSSVRRRGETSGHRNLRLTITERLTGRGVDVDTLTWDSYRMEDGRWGVTAVYLSGEAERQALFLYDVRGRFSVAGNDDARWILGEHSSARGPQPGRRRPESAGDAEDDDFEPTLDLSDELAIVRAVQEPPLAPPATVVEAEHLAEVQELRPARTEPVVQEPAGAGGHAGADNAGAGDAGAGDAGAGDHPVANTHGTAAEEPFAAGDVLGDVLSAGLAEESAIAYVGLSDASAVPESATTRSSGWEPAIVVDYPVEPSQVEPADEFGDAMAGTDQPGEPDPPTDVEDREDEADALTDEWEHPPSDRPSTDVPMRPTQNAEQPAGPDPAATRVGDVDAARRSDVAEDADVTQDANVQDSDVNEEIAPAKPSRRKRASVPSWDEIMFGSPKRP